MTETDLVRWIASRTGESDDCAVLPCAPWGTLLVTTDSVVDGVHARWDVEGPEAFGYKAVARGLSDVAAMGGRPLWAVLAVCLPRGATEEQAHALQRGAERAGCRLVGGDVAFGPVAYATATVLGRAHERGAVLRSGARPGDWIGVTGRLGAPMRTGRHHTFTARVEEARRIVEGLDVHAMIDVSDGLSTDLGHVLDASGAGARVEEARLPVEEGTALREALHEGEQYELLCTFAPDERALSALPFLTRVGTVVEGRGARLVRADGREEPLEPGGWVHGA